MSFITSVFGIWKIISGDLVEKLYMTYFVIGFASLHSDILSKTLKREKYLDIIVYINYIFIAIVVSMLLPLIFIDNAFDVLGEMYYRFLSAAGIIDGTLSILAIIFYKIYMNKHPEEQNILAGGVQSKKVQSKKIQRKGLSIWVWILIIYLILQTIFHFSSFFYYLLFWLVV